MIATMSLISTEARRYRRNEVCRWDWGWWEEEDDDETCGLLQLDDTAFDTILDDQLDGLNRAMLAETMDTIHSLCSESQ